MNANTRQATGVSRRSILAASAATPLLAGCLGLAGGGGDDYVLVATIRGDPADIDRDYEPLTDWIEDETGTAAGVDPVQSPSAAVSALATGHADAGMLSGGPAWVGWQRHDLETMVVEADEAGNTHYVAGAWVRANSDIESVADLADRDSCHTGDLTGAGMLIPMAHLAHEGLVDFGGADDVTAIRDAVDDFFGEPLVGGGYVGALQCLSTGRGEVAFARTTTPEDYCGGDDARSWCLPMGEYRLLSSFAEVPSHPIIAGIELEGSRRDALHEAFLSLNETETGHEILADVLGVHRLVESTSAAHLGAYGELIEILPGIEDHLVE